MNDTAALRQQFTAAPDRLLARLTAMGKVTVVAHDGGVTHERIGIVERINRDEGQSCSQALRMIAPSTWRTWRLPSPTAPGA